MHGLRIGGLSAIVALCLYLPSDSTAQDPRPAKETDEAKSLFPMMKFLDRDRDRQIDADELAAGQEAAALLLVLSWSDCDRDEDGAIDLAEFQAAVTEARQSLAEVEPEVEDQAVQDLASAVPLSLLLGRLSADDRYADEIASLREAIEDLDDEEAVVTYVTHYPRRYPNLTPVIRTWGRYYPVRSALRRHFHRWPHRPPAHVKPAKPRGPGPKARPKPKPGPRPKPPRPSP
jgi:hypothetical protein